MARFRQPSCGRSADYALFCLGRISSRNDQLPVAERTNQKQAEEALAAGVNLFALQGEARAAIREKSKGVYGELLHAHLLAMNVIGSATSRTSGKPGKKDADLHQRLALTASFIQGIDLCETSISEGLYVHAAALLKQEMETVAAIREVAQKKRQAGRTPNVRVFGELAVLYGDLNKVAHVGKPELLDRVVSREIAGEQSGAALIPNFDEEQAKVLYGLHVSLLAMIAAEVGTILQDLYGEGLEKKENAMLCHVAKILIDAGWLARQKGSQS